MYVCMTHTYTHLCDFWSIYIYIYIYIYICVCNIASHLPYKINQSGVNSCIRNKSKETKYCVPPYFAIRFLNQRVTVEPNDVLIWIAKPVFHKKVNFSVTFSLSARKASVGTFSFLLTAKQRTLNTSKQFSSPETNSCSRSPVVCRRNLRYSELWWRGLKSWGKLCRICHKRLPTFRKRFLLPLGSPRSIFLSTRLHISEDRCGNNKSRIVYFCEGREETGRSELQRAVLW